MSLLRKYKLYTFGIEQDDYHTKLFQYMDGVFDVANLCFDSFSKIDSYYLQAQNSNGFIVKYTIDNKLLHIWWYELTDMLKKTYEASTPDVESFFLFYVKRRYNWNPEKVKYWT